MALPFDPDWDPADPDRTCYSCGAQPALQRYHDGSPTYTCDPHGAVRAPAGWLPPAPLDVDNLYETATGIKIVLTTPVARAINGRCTLTPYEVAASFRRDKAIKKADTALGWKHRYFNADDPDASVRGIGAEIAAHHITGLPLAWDIDHPDANLLGAGYRGEKPIDIGANTEVKNVRLEHSGLAVRLEEVERNRDKAINRYYAVLPGTLPTYRFGGWMHGTELIVPERIRSDPPFVDYPVYYAYQNELHPLPLPPDA